jgi:1-acyl-sn-glycerol-3-phosphate acyltransferase
MGLSYSLAKMGFARPMASGIDIALSGAEHLPAGAAVLTCNHACDADPAVLMMALPCEVGFVAAAFMGKLPIFRTLLRQAGSVALGSTTPAPWREQVRQLLARGRKLVVFPEGQGWLLAQDFDAGLAPFHPGFAAFAHDARVPVVPMMIEPIAIENVPFVTSPIVRRLSGSPPELEQVEREGGGGALARRGDPEPHGAGGRPLVGLWLAAPATTDCYVQATRCTTVAPAALICSTAERTEERPSKSSDGR